MSWVGGLSGKKTMKQFIMMLLCICCAGCQYGPKQDYGRFKSAALMQDGRMIVFTFHDLVYRPAKGFAAFPDGGIPKYIKDRSFLCTFERSTGKLIKLMEETNREWANGSGSLHIVTSRGNAVVVVQSGQKRRDLGAVLTRYHILNIETGKHDTFDLADDLRKHGRQTGPIYLGDDSGTLVIITPSEHSDEGSKPSGDGTPQIWVRRMGGHYLFAGESAHYQQTVNGDVIYWKPQDRQYYAFSIEKGKTRLLEGYRIPEQERVMQGVSVGNSGVNLEIGILGNNGWQYTPLPINTRDVRGL